MISRLFAPFAGHPSPFLAKKLGELEDHPETCSEYVEYDANGRLLDACVCEGYAIIFWQDVADRQVKVLRIEPADS